MQLYNCPNCGAREPANHRETCSLAGHPVWPGYNPPDWPKARALLQKQIETWKYQYTGRTVVIDAQSLDYVIVETSQAFDPKNLPFGKAPGAGHHLLFQRLIPA